MECVSIDNKLATISVETAPKQPKSRTKANARSKAKSKNSVERDVRNDPRSRAVNRSARAAEFARFADDLRRDLNPRGPLETLVTLQVVQSAWELKSTLDRVASRESQDELDPDVDRSPRRTNRSTADLAVRSIKDALETLDYLRSRPTRSSLTFLPTTDHGHPIEPNEWPIVPTDGLDDFQTDPEPSTEETPNWRDRLVFDFEVSDVSPVVKGTWITVTHVVSQIVDGSTWADILRSHPELSEEDIRTCVAYAMDEENLVH